MEKEHLKAANKVLTLIKDIEKFMKKENRSLIFHNSTKKHDGSAKAYLEFIIEHYNAYHSQMNETIQIKKIESEISVLKNKLFQVTSTTLQPGYEKYYDNSKETTTTPYPPLMFNESEYEYLLMKKRYYEESLKKEEMNVQKLKEAQSFWSYENYFG